ncbi:MAG: methylated-DNA--[protein]-cysteine S-methyltransferase [Bacteroidetes bacterium]|nr:methylated-DNA--[protein]-cysteine S-methyltransferase [Bacteroidota bacterium]
MSLFISFQTPLGFITIKENQGLINSVKFGASDNMSHQSESELLEKTRKHILKYLQFNQPIPELPLEIIGTNFQKLVWTKLMEIPNGSTKSYLNFSEEIADSKSVRAVASAIAKNPLPIIIPCHRIVGTNGSMTGYLGGLEAKKYLLNLEKGIIQNSIF